jgi:hypothetical protein
VTDQSARSSRRDRAPRWTAPLTAFGSLVVLGATYAYFSLGQMTFLEIPETENAALAQEFSRAAAHASDTARSILQAAAVVALLAGLLGAIRPVRRVGILGTIFTLLALVTVWAATRADIALLSSYR